MESLDEYYQYGKPNEAMLDVLVEADDTLGAMMNIADILRTLRLLALCVCMHVLCECH